MFDDPTDTSPWGCLGAMVVVTALIFAGALFVVRGMNSIGSRSGSDLEPAPPAEDFGTVREVGTRGDDPNPGARYRGLFPSDDQTQEREIGGRPARFSGYTTWVDSVSRVPAARFTDAYRGSYLRVHVTVFNRDIGEQHVCACDFKVWTRSHGYREADAVDAAALAPYTEMAKGDERSGDVYLYVGHVAGPYFVVFDPDAHVADATSTARGVWEVARERAVSGGGSRSTPTVPPTTHA